MTSSQDHPFSDLSPEQVQRLIEIARAERARAIRTMVLKLFRRQPTPDKTGIGYETPVAPRPSGA